MDHIFGLKVCGACPDCNLAGPGHAPCADEVGSNAMLVGGVFGRMDAAYITIEAQKSTGSLHAHCQCFVQCLHQHTALEEIFEMGEERLEQLRQDYLRYSAHAMHGVYDGHGSEAVAEKIAQAEASWPEHKLQTRMIETPAYQRRRARDDIANEVEEASAWATEYLQEDVAELQFLKQHHYHPLNPERRTHALARVPKGRQSQRLQE